MKLSTRFVLFCFLFPALFAAGCSVPAVQHTHGKQWVRFSYDINKPDTFYYYDRESVQDLSNNRISTWLRISSPKGDDFILTEIECSSPMFRTVEPYKPLFFNPDKTSYVAYGWVEIPPDSEVRVLRDILCKQPK